MYNTIINIALAAVAVGLLILVHELGHFLAARAVGVRVETFSIGFWKKIAGFRKGDTEYRLSVIPLGGYVKLAGEMEGEGSGEPDEFSSKSPGARALVLVSGVAMNVVFALFAFMLAFTIGVPFPVAEVGMLERGAPAWEAGLRPGDRIVDVNGVSNPDFQDLQRHVALLGREVVTIEVERDDGVHVFELKPEYDEDAGMRLIGFAPPFEPVVTALAEVNNGRSPAHDAGVMLGDRILRVNGREIEYFRHIQDALKGRGGDTVSLEIQRGPQELTVDVETAYAERYVMGISGVDTKIVSLQGGGLAAESGLRPGDEIKRIMDRPVRSPVEIENTVRENYGNIPIAVERDGELHEMLINLPDENALDDLMFSFTSGSGTEMTWVGEGGPAWSAGIRAGDKITEVAGRTVTKWRDIIEVNERKGAEPRLVRWEREGESFEETVVPELSREDASARIGALFNMAKTQRRRESVGGAVVTGIKKTYGAFADMVFTIRGFIGRDVSTRHVGGIVLIAVASFHAAAGGLGQLMYFTALISAALAFLNILPIPVLDGGHLMFIGIEKIRGRPVSEKVMGISQTVGLTLLLLLVFYAIRNDILRLIG